MRVLITGGTGFIGSEIMKEALFRGHEVAVLTRNPGALLPVGARRIIGSLANYSWDEIVSFHPEICIHSAWLTTPGIYLESSKNHEWYEQSLQFLLRMPEAGVGAIYALGTCIECAPSSVPLTDDEEVAPSSTYARCKVDLYVSLKKELSSKTRFCWLRLFYPYGENEPAGKLVSLTISKLLAGEKMELKSPHEIVDYIHVSDVAKAVLAAVDSNLSGIVNLGSGRAMAVSEIVDCIARVVGSPDLTYEASVTRLQAKGRVASTQKIRSIDWLPTISLEEGIRRMVFHHSQKLHS